MVAFFIMSKQFFLKIFLGILSSVMGLLFIYSGWTKLNPIEPFEYTFVDLGIVNWALAPFVARFLIGLEFFIGIMLFFNLYLKKFTLKITAATLLIFTAYLTFIIIKNGNNGNCGCFGEVIPMTPRDAIIKNVIMLGACFLIYRYHEGFSFGKLTVWLSVLFLLTSMALPHILNYVDLSYSEAYLNKPEDKFELTLDTLYNNAYEHTPPRTLSQGKHILAFMSLKCPHCRVAAKKMRIMHEKNPDISFYFILNGDKENLKAFYADTKTEDIPYCMLRARPFIYLAGTNLPTLYLVNNSVVEHWVNYMELDQKEIEKWMNN
jgi:hypothetical protein